MAKPYDFKRIEEKWLKKWHESGIFNANVNDTSRPKFYNLSMFPYPSAATLHAGHAYTYGGVDVYGRFKKHMGYNVFQPMGFDAFGIHGENFAIKVNRHPRDVLEENVTTFRAQMDRLGAMFDWSHSVNTTYPDYYKWTQWLFIKLYKQGLAERKSSQVNWCPSCKTVLSDEQVIQGKCERCGTVTEKKEMLQWFFKISDYAQRLLDNHKEMDWTEKTITLQRNWIGRSEGATITFDVVDAEGNSVAGEKIEVFTTRPDTLFGATFLIVSTKHEALKRIHEDFYEKVDRYIKEAESQTALDTQKEKTGEFIGLYGVNPLSGEKVPIFVANYVLASYGTGALMGVPAHDARDYDFARNYNVEIKKVIASESDLPYEGEGKLIDSGKYSDMDSSTAREQIVKDLKKMKKGNFTVTFKLRDWLISRQRYWGPPIPIIYCDTCGTVPVPEEDLPVFLPNIEDFKPKGDGKSPLAGVESFVNTTCPKCGGKAKRETDVIDNFVDSSWYFLRYPSVGNDTVAFEKNITEYWLPVDMYIGGNEHAVLHLMYTRFIVMALHDMGLLSFEEPFHKFRANGLIIKDGAKMSKSKGNVVNPDDYIEKYGTDVLRTYLLFLGPFSEGGDFSDKNILGIVRFIDRVWALQDAKGKGTKDIDITPLQKLINSISDDLDNLRYNTAIAGLMEYVNWLYKNREDMSAKQGKKVIKDLIIMLSVFAPFITDEMWEILGYKENLLEAEWPYIQAVIDKKVKLPVQVNGKLRGLVEVDHGATEETVLKKAMAIEGIERYIPKKKYDRIVFVPNKVVNIIL